MVLVVDSNSKDVVIYVGVNPDPVLDPTLKKQPGSGSDLIKFTINFGQ